MKLFLLLYLLQKLVLPTNALQCMNEDNKPVDWFMVYKLPVTKQHHNKALEQGVAYTFVTPEDYSTWKFSDKSIGSANSIIGNTVEALYSKDKAPLYILYNDQPPEGNSNSKDGHSKGVVMANGTSGFWLVHSVPRFPALKDTYTFPKSGSVYGQSFLCISLDLNNLNKVGIQLQYNEPQIYSQNITVDLKTLLPELAKAAQNVTIQNAPWYNVVNLQSLSGLQFASFAKSRKFLKELYEDLVAPYLGTDLFVETWPNGQGRLHSDCSKKFKVNNIKSVYLNSANVSFTSTDDHSKWAVSPPESKNWLCIGDINRAEHQKKRGGGTVCLSNKDIANDYQKSIESIEDCKKVV